jgi:pilus assembly protein CpaD
MQIKDTDIRGPRKIAASLARIFTFVLLPALIGGCKHDEAGTRVAGWALIDPAQRHPILVSQQPANLTLRVSSNSVGLTPAQRARVMDFVNRSRAGDAGNSRIVISAPGGSANEGAAMEAAEEVRQLMLDSGYSESSIAVEAYHASGSDAPLRVSYLRYVAEAPECGQDWSVNLARDYQNVGYPNLGCANQRNLAVMVANPSDLLGPRTMTPRDSKRRDDTYDKYVKGAATGSASEVSTVQKPVNQ